MIKDQIGKNMKIYIDNMLVKSNEEIDHMNDLNEMFGVLWKYKMKLNPQSVLSGFNLEIS